MQRKSRILAIIASAGLVLIAFHVPYTDGIIHIPTIGLLLMSMSCACWLILNYKNISHGNKYIYVPLLVIATSISTSGILNQLWYTIPAGWLFYCIYLIARKEGTAILWTFGYGVILATFGIVLFSILNPGIKTGGYVISPTNYDIATGFLIIGTVLSLIKRQWILLSISLVGLILTGAEEALFVLAIMLVVVIVRKDFSKKILLPISITCIVIVIITSLGITEKLYETILVRADLMSDINQESLRQASGDRLFGNWQLSPIKPFGYGFNMTNFYPGIPHTVPLIIIEQVGILAMLSWVFLMFYLLLKTKLKYAVMAILALSVFDHFIWTQIAPYQWAVAGVASVYTKDDYFFKEVQDVTPIQSIPQEAVSEVR